jgi:hypothetical protein
MKSLLMAALLAVGMFTANESQALVAGTFRCNMSACSSTITLDSGVGKKCTRTSDSCQCSKYVSDCCPAQVASTCGSLGSGWSSVGAAVGGGFCCKYTLSGGSCPQCRNQPDQNDSEETSVKEANTDNDQNLDEVFETGMDDSRLYTNTYYGFKDDIPRSPPLGRTTAPVASLDACLDHPDVDTIDATPGTSADKWAACVGSSIGCGATVKNEYCRATGLNDGVSVSAAVCKDRCDCIYGIGTCGNQ